MDAARKHCGEKRETPIHAPDPARSQCIGATETAHVERKPLMLLRHIYPRRHG